MSLSAHQGMKRNLWVVDAEIGMLTSDARGNASINQLCHQLSSGKLLVPSCIFLSLLYSSQRYNFPSTPLLDNIFSQHLCGRFLRTWGTASDRLETCRSPREAPGIEALPAAFAHHGEADRLPRCAPSFAGFEVHRCLWQAPQYMGYQRLKTTPRFSRPSKGSRTESFPVL
jgi:hypothetical protein